MDFVPHNLNFIQAINNSICLEYAYRVFVRRENVHTVTWQGRPTQRSPGGQQGNRKGKDT